jgi:phosphate starvation-inducible PhoH-like protein
MKVATQLSVLDHDDQLGTMPKSGKRSRKQKKMNEKEIQYFFDDDDTLKSSPLKLYQNMSYLSNKEKQNFEQQFHQPKNKSQELYIHLLQDKNKKIVVSNGPAGTGKTLFATECGIKFLLTGVYDKLIFTRPSVSVDEDLGYLPGSLEEKMAPWVRPIYDILYRFLSPREVSQMIEDKVIEISPLGFMRGRTFVNAWIVADEMQNSTVAQMKMLLTRLGENSRLIITGDLEQYDHNFEKNGLDDFLQRFKGKRSSSISSFEFERNDVQREEVVKEILDIYSGEVLPDYSSEENSV